MIKAIQQARQELGLAPSLNIAEVHVPVSEGEIRAAVAMLERKGMPVTRRAVADVLRAAASEGLFDLVHAPEGEP